MFFKVYMGLAEICSNKAPIAAINSLGVSRLLQLIHIAPDLVWSDPDGCNMILSLQIVAIVISGRHTIRYHVWPTGPCSETWLFQLLFIYVTHIGSTHIYLFLNMSKFYCLHSKEEVGWGCCLLVHLPFACWSLYLLLHSTPLSASCEAKKKEVAHHRHFRKQGSLI